MSEIENILAAVRKADEEWFLANWPGATEEDVKENSPRITDNYSAIAIAAVSALKPAIIDLFEIDVKINKAEPLEALHRALDAILTDKEPRE